MIIHIPKHIQTRTQAHECTQPHDRVQALWAHSRAGDWDVYNNSNNNIILKIICSNNNNSNNNNTSDSAKSLATVHEAQSTKCSGVVMYVLSPANLRMWFNSTTFNTWRAPREIQGSGPETSPPAVAHVLFVWRWRTGKDACNYSTSHGVRTWCVLAQV